MKPYYQDDFVTLYHGDCRELLLDLDLSAAGVVVADPPYGDTSLAWDRWPADWPDAVAAAVPESCALWCFGSLRMFLAHGGQFGAWTYAQDVVWEKHNGSSFHADRFKRVHEHVVQWYRGPWANVWKLPVTTADATRRTVRRKERPPHTGEIAGSTYASVDGGPRLARSVIRVRSCHGEAQHPTQKPLGIVAPLLAYSLQPGAVAVDPFAGSGTTLRAAKDAGVRAIGIEIQERFCEVAARRLSQGVLWEAPDRGPRQRTPGARHVVEVEG